MHWRDNPKKAPRDGVPTQEDGRPAKRPRDTQFIPPLIYILLCINYRNKLLIMRVSLMFVAVGRLVSLQSSPASLSLQR